jgi:hypothetical protein
MYSTSVYTYIPRHIVVLYQGTSPRRFKPVYAKNLKLHKGVNNTIQFQFLNQDQKPVNLTGNEIAFRLISDDGKTLLSTKTLSISPSDGALPLTGIAVLKLEDNDINDINTQMCKYSLEIKPQNSSDPGNPVFVDDYAGGRGTVQLLSSILPDFVASQHIGLPNHQLPTQQNPVTYNSSVFSSINRSYTFTMQLTLDAYIGTIQLQAATEVDGEYMDLGDPYEFTTATTGVEAYVIDYGIHPFYRLVFVSTNGDITDILVR